MQDNFSNADKTYSSQKFLVKLNTLSHSPLRLYVFAPPINRGRLLYRCAIKPLRLCAIEPFFSYFLISKKTIPLPHINNINYG